jgi:hypothetical protein
MRNDRQAILSRRARFMAVALASAGLAAVDGGARDPSDAAAVQDAGTSSIQSALDAARRGNTLAIQAALTGADPEALASGRDAIAELEAECSRRADAACSTALLVARHAAAEGRVPEAERSRWLDRITELRAKVGQLVLEIAPDAGEIFVDDVSFGKTPGERIIYLEPGRHTVVQADAYGQSSSQFVELTAGGSVRVRIPSLEEIGPMVCLSPPPPPPPPPSERPRGCGCGTVGRG